MQNVRTQRGFTIIELLVVVAIIGLLSSVVLSSLAEARAKARDTERLQELRQVQTALEQYRTTYGQFPATGTSGNPVLRAQCAGLPETGTLTGASGWVPNVAPTFISVLPADPKPGATGTGQCYAYMSDGANYLLVAYGTVEILRGAKNPAPWPAFSTEPSFAFYTDGARMWPL